MKKTLFILLGFVLLISLLLGACKATTTTTTSTKPATTTTTATTKPATTAPATTTPAATTTAAPTGDQYGGTLKWALTVGPSRPIGYLPEAANDSYTCASPALDRLAKLRLDGTIEGVLATGWKVADDLSSLTLTLRKGVKFHDGSDWNADVCKWNLEGIMAAKVSITTSWKSIDKIDDYTVRINLLSYQNKLLTDLASGGTEMTSKAYFDKNGIDAARWNPVGTGPFIFVEYQRDAKLTYKRNPNYWDTGKPYLDGITMTVIADATVRKLAFQKGDIHILQASGLDAQELQKAGYFTRISAGGTYLLVPDSKNPSSPWANVNVRLAASYALDRVALAKALGFGFGAPAYQLYPGFPDAKIPNLIPTVFDQAKAKDLLRQAGYPNGFKTVIHNFGRVLTSQDFTLAVAAQLRAVGIDVTTDFPEAGKYDDLRYKGWNDGLLNHGIIAMDNKNQALNLYFSGTGFVTLKMPAGFQEGFTASLNSKDYDPKLVQTVLQLMYDDMTVIPYIELQNTAFEQKGVHNPGGDVYNATYQEYQSIWLDKSAR
ncbi:MAG: ABC transporter substrate-binding protein [Dehalococcoidales bacterium]